MELKDRLNIRITPSDEKCDEFSIEATEIQEIKSSDLPKDKLIVLDEDTIFKFDYFVKDDYLILKLTEVDALAPFIYITQLTLDDLIKIHKIFRACDDLNEVEKHIISLYKENRIKLSQEKKDEIIFNITAFDISVMVSFKIIAERKITDSKDAMLLKLYEIQKKRLKILKEIEKFVKDGNPNAKEIKNKIKEIKENIDNKK